MLVEATITVPENYKAFGKSVDQWTDDDWVRFKNEIASDFSTYDLGHLNEKTAGSMVSDRKVISFE